MRLRSAVLMLVVPTALAAQVRSGAYVTQRSGMDIARERYRYDGRVLQSEVELISGNLFLKTEVTFGDGGVPVHYTARVLAGVDGAVMQDVAADFRDSVQWTLSAGARVQRGSAPLPKPFVVIQNLVFAQLAAAILTYDRATGGRQVLNAWRPDGATIMPLTLTVAGDSGELELGGVRSTFVVGDDGWLSRLRVPAQGITVERRADVAFSPRAAAGAADTVPPRTVREEPIQFADGAVRLAGTLTTPADDAGPFPVALIVAGSGAVDRDGNAPPALRSNLYAQVAWRLAEQGIATARYDKRGVGASAQGFDPAMMTFDDMAEDVVVAARELAQDPRCSRVVILGHSEGGWLAVRAALRGAPVAGIALLAAAGRPFLVVLRDQLAQQLDSAALGVFDSAMTRYLRGELPVGLPAYLEPLFRPANQRFMQSIVAYDALAELRRVHVPVLIVQGDRDVQIAQADASRLGDVAADARVVLIPGANHLFKAALASDRVRQLASYTDPTIPVVPELVDAIVQWVEKLADRE